MFGIAYGRYFKLETKTKRTLRIIRIIVAVIWCAIIILCLINRDKFTVDGIVKITPEHTLLAVLVMMIFFALKSVSVFIYFGIIFAASGIIFPLRIAIPVNLIGTVVMVTIPFFIGRFLGSDMVNYIFEKYPRAAHLHERRKQNDFLLTLLFRLTGAMPSDLLAFYMGASGSKFGAYLVASVLGFSVSSVTFPLMGDKIRDPKSPQFIISFCIEASVVILTSGGLIIRHIIKNRQEKKALEQQKP